MEQTSEVRVQAAAAWIRDGRIDRTKALVPQIQSQFGLSGKEAVQAIREVNLIRARAH